MSEKNRININTWYKLHTEALMKRFPIVIKNGVN